MFFKRKKEEREKSKLNELQEKCNFLNIKYKNTFGLMCMNKDGVLFYIKGFDIRDNNIKIIIYKGVEGFISIMDYELTCNFMYKDYDEFFSIVRQRFTDLQKKLRDFKLEIVKIKNKDDIS